jgi:hypothetical protein
MKNACIRSARVPLAAGKPFSLSEVKTMNRLCLFLFAVVGLAIIPGVSFAQIAGDYDSSYEGLKNVRITRDEDVYRVRWDLADGTHWVGVGLLSAKGDTFTVASVVSRGNDDEYVNGSLHVSVYRVMREGERVTGLVSDCARYGDKKVHNERLTPKK